MTFVRTWDSSCPQVWDSWEADGKKWVIQDLPPEDDEDALQILLQHLCPDEILCLHNDLVNDAVSMRGITEIWRKRLAKRTTLACYVDTNGNHQLAALNVCLVVEKGDASTCEINGKSWKNVNAAVSYCEMKVDKFEYLGMDRVMYAMGLVVVRNFRGMKLGARVLAAREHLCRHLGIKGTVTVFTSVPSQRCADRTGFTTIATITWKELAEAGLDYPKDESKEIKLMAKKYD